MKKVRKWKILGVFLVFVLSLCFQKPTPVGGLEQQLKENPEVAAKFFEECSRRAQSREIEDYMEEMDKDKKLLREF